MKVWGLCLSPIKTCETIVLLCQWGTSDQCSLLALSDGDTLSWVGCNLCTMKHSHYLHKQDWSFTLPMGPLPVLLAGGNMWKTGMWFGQL